MKTTLAFQTAASAAFLLLVAACSTTSTTVTDPASHEATMEADPADVGADDGAAPSTSTREALARARAKARAAAKPVARRSKLRLAGARSHGGGGGDSTDPALAINGDKVDQLTDQYPGAADELADADPIAGPEPKLEPLSASANRPYRLRGRSFRPMTSLQPFRQRGMASWYGKPFHGRKTAIGERYDMNEMTAAHPTLPLPSYARVRNLKTGVSVIVRVNDRGPFAAGRIIDLSRAAARHLGFVDGGVAPVEVALVIPDPAGEPLPTPVAASGN